MISLTFVRPVVRLSFWRFFEGWREGCPGRGFRVAGLPLGALRFGSGFG